MLVKQGSSTDTCLYQDDEHSSAPSWNFIAQVYNLNFDMEKDCVGEYLYLVNDHTCCFMIGKLKSQKASSLDDSVNIAREMYNSTEEIDRDSGVAGIRPIDLSEEVQLESISNDCGDRCCPDNLIRDWETCNDGITYFKLEPKCELALLERIDSGKCDQTSGICHKGHCCPPTDVKHKMKIGVKPYVTTMGCSSKCEIPINMTFAYCDPNKKKIAFFGKQKSYSDELSGIDRLAEPCRVNPDCRLGYVCVNTRDVNGFSTRECFQNPMVPIRTLRDSVFTIPMIAIGFLLILMFVQLKALHS